MREERPDDRGEVHALNVAAFGNRVEAELVDRLRAREAIVVALVAEEAGLEGELEAPPEAFMALELQAGAASRIAGIARYHSVFFEL